MSLSVEAYYGAVFDALTEHAEFDCTIIQSGGAYHAVPGDTYGSLVVTTRVDPDQYADILLGDGREAFAASCRSAFIGGRDHA